METGGVKEVKDWKKQLYYIDRIIRIERTVIKSSNIESTNNMELFILRGVEYETCGDD